MNKETVSEAYVDAKEKVLNPELMIVPAGTPDPQLQALPESEASTLVPVLSCREFTFISELMMPYSGLVMQWV